MAVVSYDESFAERAVSGQWRESYKFTRSFYVRVDTLDTDLYEILSAPGINYLDSHPEYSWAVMQDFDVKCCDESGLYYRVVFTYFVLQRDGESATTIPPDVWSATGSITTGPATRDKDGSAIVNSAGDAIEGLEMDIAEMRLSLVRCYPNLSWTGVAYSYTNAVNSAGWNSSPARSWKCHFMSAVKQVEVRDQTRIAYWQTTWDFVYRAPNWDLRPLNLGLMQKVSGAKKVIKVDGEPVSQPVPLNSDGTANASGTAAVINSGNGSRVYVEQDFSVFGTPS